MKNLPSSLKQSLNPEEQDNKVIIYIRNGEVEITKCPEGVEVEIYDLDQLERR